MAGLIGNAPIYVNGLLSLFFVFVLPGLALVSFLDIPDFPRRWLVILLASLTVSHALVVLVAAFHLDPLLSFRIAFAAVTAALVAGTVRQRNRQAGRGGGSVLNASDLRLLAVGLVVLALTYFNVWKHGVPNVFGEGDVSISWNSWALIWSQGAFPSGALGYPQFIPTIWSVTYIFTGSTEQYFAFYIYIGLITIPLLLTAMILARIGWWQPAAFWFTFIWFIAEIQEQWLRSTLQEGFPDWVIAVFALCGFALFVTNTPDDSFDRTRAIAAICMLSIAAATKPMYGLIAIALLLATIVDGYRQRDPAGRHGFLVAAAGPLAIFVILYAIYYAHLAARGMPHYPATELSQRLSQTWSLFHSNFTLPFKIVVAAGLLCGPFLPRIRWLMLPLYVGFTVWANTAGYDLRNVLGFLLISAFIAIYTAGRMLLAGKSLALGNRQWRAADGVVAAVLVSAVLALTWTLAVSDSDMKRRFADDQFRRGQGPEFNHDIGRLLDRGCTLLTSSSYPHTISAFQRYRSRMEFFFYSLPIDEATQARFQNAAGCVAILYPLQAHPSIQAFIASYVQSRNLQKLREGGGMVLAASEK